MSKMHNVVLPVALFISALALSSCASEPKVEPVAAPAEMTAPVEAPVVAPESAPAPEVVAEPATPKPAVRKAKKVAKPAPQVVAPPPVEAPAPVAQPETPVVQPLAPVTVAPIEETIPEAGFLEKYWLWLLALIVAIVGIVIWRSMSKGEQ